MLYPAERNASALFPSIDISPKQIQFSSFMDVFFHGYAFYDKKKTKSGIYSNQLVICKRKIMALRSFYTKRVMQMGNGVHSCYDVLRFKDNVT